MSVAAQKSAVIIPFPANRPAEERELCQKLHEMWWKNRGRRKAQAARTMEQQTLAHLVEANRQLDDHAARRPSKYAPEVAQRINETYRQMFGNAPVNLPTKRERAVKGFMAEGYCREVSEALAKLAEKLGLFQVGRAGA